jgi:predicted SAM-dependent methyltransferase
MPGVRSWLKRRLPPIAVRGLQWGDRRLHGLFRRARFLRTRRRAKRICRQGTTICLELGSAIPRPRYYTVDLGPDADLTWDVRFRLPFPSDSVEQVYTSHMLEHLSREDMVRLLGDVHRVLRTGGELKIAVPDAALCVRKYLEGDLGRLQALAGSYPLRGRMDLLNWVAYYGDHRQMFDEENLTKALLDAGFAAVHPREFDPALDHPRRRQVSLFVSAVKGAPAR